jgi:hypothetical protein
VGGDGQRDAVTLQERLIGEVRPVADGFEVDVNLNWYRSLPLSCVATLEVTADGEDVPFTFNGYTLDELKDRWDEYWFVLDPATLRVRREIPTEVSVRIGVRIPYLPHGVVYVSELTAAVNGA